MKSCMGWFSRGLTNFITAQLGILLLRKTRCFKLIRWEIEINRTICQASNVILKFHSIMLILFDIRKRKLFLRREDSFHRNRRRILNLFSLDQLGLKLWSSKEITPLKASGFNKRKYLKRFIR